MATTSPSAWIVTSVETDPARNLALEEWLYRHRRPHQRILLLYRNQASVVLGRNQTPWGECDLQHLSDNGIPVLRRISGGGAVYHDTGNLNYAFIVPREGYSRDELSAVVTKALCKLGVPACTCQHHAIWVAGRKVSGTAFAMTSASVLHHGCILIGTDLGALERSLRPPRLLLEHAAVTSIRSPVTRLGDAPAPVSVEAVADAISRGFRSLTPGADTTPVSPEELVPRADLQSLLGKYRGWSWTYGRTPPFRAWVPVSGRVGCNRLELSVRNGVIDGVEAAGDVSCSEPVSWLAQALRGVPCDRRAVIQRGHAEWGEDASCSGLLLAVETVAAALPCLPGVSPGQLMRIAAEDTPGTAGQRES